MDGVVELEIPARPEYLSLARLVVAAAASLEPSLRDERIEDLRVAVSEATTNAIESHTALDGEERIVIRCALDDERIEVWIVDQGAGFDPASVDELPDISDPARLEIEGGFGLPLMRVLTDEAEIRSSPGGTAVKLVVHHHLRNLGSSRR
jgi:serine/threonine-protein kinase RsbW